MKKIPLSPIDHVFTGTGSYPIEFVFAYQGLIDPEKLLSSFKQTVLHFPPVQSQLIKQNGNYCFLPSDDGYRFEAVEQSINFNETDQREIFIDPVVTEPGEPLTRIRLSQTPAGSVLGVSISHCIADGFSYFFFLASWARVFHGKSIMPPSHERQLLIPQTRELAAVSSEELLEKTGLFIGKQRTDIRRDQLKWEMIKYKSDDLKLLVEKAQQSCELRLSHNDVIVASLWKKYLADRAANCDDHKTFISCPMDYRRVLPDFPKTYFGNAVTLTSISLPCDRLIQSTVAELAVLVRSGIGSVDEKYIRDGLKTLCMLTRSEGTEINERIRVCHPDHGLLVTNLSRLPVREIKFDAGPPTAYEILTPANRGAVILPSKDGDGVEVRICWTV